VENFILLQKGVLKVGAEAYWTVLDASMTGGQLAALCGSLGPKIRRSCRRQAAKGKARSALEQLVDGKLRLK